MKNLLAMVSKQVWITGKIGFLFRDNADLLIPQFTGWIVTSGTETEEEQADDKQFELVCIECLAAINNQIISIMETPPRCAFCLTDEGTFEQVYDFDWDSYQD